VKKKKVIPNIPLEVGTKVRTTFGSKTGLVGFIVKFIRTNGAVDANGIPGHVYLVKLEGYKKSVAYHHDFLEVISQPKVFVGDIVVAQYDRGDVNWNKKGCVIKYKGPNESISSNLYEVSFFHSRKNDTYSDAFLKLSSL
jgi:hypothetical protein